MGPPNWDTTGAAKGLPTSMALVTVLSAVEKVQLVKEL